MGQYHTVAQGECLASIAKRYGFVDYRTIYDHPANAELKRIRSNPHILYPGDRLFIPDKELKQHTAATEQRHRFQLAVQSVRLRLRLRDRDGQPLRDKRYRLIIEGRTLAGHTDAEGALEQLVPAGAEQGELTIWLDDASTHDAGFIYPLLIGHLDPIEEVEGVQGRLNNLGFHCGAVDGQIGTKTQEALRALQAKYGLPVTGELDDATRGKLLELHDAE